MASVGSIIGGGLRVVRDRPGSVAIWGLTYIVGYIVIAVLMALIFAGSIGFGRMSEPGQMPAFSGGFLLGMLFYLLAYVLLLSVLMNAVFRSVLRPEERSFASLRIGSDEWRMFGLVIIVVIAAIILTFIAGLLLGLVMSLMTVIAGDNVMLGTAFRVVLILAFYAFLSG